jgi:hypothetical protein
MPTPNQVSVLAFNVDFGDCFLLRFSYKEQAIGDKHVLIDFGATRAKKDKLTEIAEEIARQCKGKLDVLVATHRHKDHISGFATSKEGDSGDIIRKLKPTIVMQPWTEDPDVPENATGPRTGMHAFANTLKGMDAFASSVKSFAETLTEERDWLRLGFTKRERDFLAFAGENNIANASAVKNLIEMGKAGKPMFLHADLTPDISDILPGVTLDVLGPPTPKQHAKVRKQNPRNDAQYWLKRAADLPALAAAGHERKLFAIAQPNDDPDELSPHWRWISKRVVRLRKDMLLPIVRALDNAMNNTSLILLFRLGGKSLLFPGDAQWENWEYALEAAPKKDEYRKMLAAVDFYKVGHHGSLNATPKSLWELFDRKNNAQVKGRLTSVMSTMHNVHGETPETAVPRSTLVEELETFSDHYSTEKLAADKPFQTVVIDVVK